MKGFEAFVVDPNDLRARPLKLDRELREIHRSIDEGPPFDENKYSYHYHGPRTLMTLRGVVWWGMDLLGNAYGRVLAQIRNEPERVLICASSPKCAQDCARYFVSVFQQGEGDVLAFLANRDEWSEEKYNRMKEIPVTAQYVCRRVCQEP